MGGGHQGLIEHSLVPSSPSSVDKSHGAGAAVKGELLAGNRMSLLASMLFPFSDSTSNQRVPESTGSRTVHLKRLHVTLLGTCVHHRAKGVAEAGKEARAARRVRALGPTL